MEEINELVSQRSEKIQEFRARGIEPYPYRYEVQNYAAQLLESFSSQSDIKVGEHPVKMAGRLMLMRPHGKISFAHIQDSTGRIQIYIGQNDLGPDKYEIFKKLDVGDIIGVEGSLFRTRTGELTVYVTNFEILSKSLRPLPEKWHGLRDKETRYRQRYVDLIVNPDVKKVFVCRAKIVSAIREFLDERGYLEVETPVLQPIYGGASAKPFMTYHNALGVELYLRIADELYLKRLIVGGFDKVYEFSRNFRNEGMDKFHNPEFTMLEFYQAYSDYYDMMFLSEELISFVAKKVLGKTQIEYKGHIIELSPPWERVSMIDAINQKLGIEVKSFSTQQLLEIAAQRGLDVKEVTSGGKLIALLFETYVQPALIQPTFVTDFPLEISPLAKKKRDDPTIVERFELFIGQLELANAFSELNDPIDQGERFIDQMKQKDLGDEEAQTLDEDFIRALEYGMPPTGGFGIGIDRLTMLFTNNDSIRDVILFPQMRPER